METNGSSNRGEWFVKRPLNHPDRKDLVHPRSWTGSEHGPARMVVYRWANTFAMNSPVAWSYVPSKRPFAALSHSRFFDKVW